MLKAIPLIGGSSAKEFSRLLSQDKWIPTEEGFKSIKDVSLDAEDARNLYPYIHNPIQEIIDDVKTKTFYQDVGIPAKISSYDLLEVLERIEIYYKKMPIGPKWGKDRKVIIYIVRTLTSNSDRAMILGKLKLPVRKQSSISFLPPAKCYYNDVKNEKQRSLLKNSLGVGGSIDNIVDLDIDSELANVLKLKPVTDMLLSVEQLGYNTEGIEKFGQHEDITQRIITAVTSHVQCPHCCTSVLVLDWYLDSITL